MNFKNATVLHLLQIDIQNGHGEVIGQFPVFLVLGNHPDELVADINFAAVVLLRALAHGDGWRTKCVAKIFGQLGKFFGVQSGRLLHV